MEYFSKFFQSYNYIDVIAMLLSLVCTHYMVKKKRFAFLFGMGAAIGFGIIMFQAKSGPILIGEFIWFYQNYRGWLKWGKESKVKEDLGSQTE